MMIMSSVVGDGCLRRIAALFEHLISTHSLMSFLLGTTMAGFTRVYVRLSRFRICLELLQSSS